MPFFTLETNPNPSQEYLVDMRVVVHVAEQQVQLRLRFIPDQYTITHEAFRHAAERLAQDGGDSLEALLHHALHAMNNEILPLWGQLIGTIGDGVEQKRVLVEDVQPGYELSPFAKRIAGAI